VYEDFETPEDVALQFEVAGGASRFGAYVLDRLLILLGQLALILLTVGAVYLAGGLEGLSDGALIAALIILFGFSEILYFGVLEWRNNGSTPGKKKVGLRTIREGGYRLDAGAAWLRNIFRPIDLIPIFWIVPILDRRGRRLGDMVAGTIVSREKKMDAVAHALSGNADLNDGFVPVYFQLSREQLARLSWKDIQALEGFVTRASTLETAARRRLARALARPILAKLDVIPPADGDTANWLQEIFELVRRSPGLLEEIGERDS